MHTGNPTVIDEFDVVQTDQNSLQSVTNERMNLSSATVPYGAIREMAFSTIESEETTVSFDPSVPNSTYNTPCKKLYVFTQYYASSYIRKYVYRIFARSNA